MSGVFISVRKVVLQILNGFYSQKVNIIYIFFVLLFYIIGCIFSLIFFPGQYTILNNSISELGSTESNPEGCWIFKVNLIITGFFLVINFLFLYKRLKSTYLLRLSIFLCVIGIIGLALTAAFPIEIQPQHQIVGNIGGISLSIGSTLMIFKKNDVISNDRLENKSLNRGFILIHGQFIITMILGIIMMNSSHFAGIWNIDPRLFGFKLWQWCHSFAFAIWIIGINLIVPDKNLKGE